MRLTEVGGTSGREASLTELYKGALIQKESSAFFSKYLYPALLKQDPRYHRSSSPSFWGRMMYAARSTSATFTTFASTIGSDAGINILHEFEPGVRRIVKAHAPKFVPKIKDRITNDQTDQILSGSSTTPR
jgi:hypothetical protein